MAGTDDELSWAVVGRIRASLQLHRWPGRRVPRDLEVPVHTLAARSPRSALLLSGSLGMGHDVTAEALADVLGGLGWRSRTVDSMELLGRRAGRMGEAVFRGLLATPGAYDALHFSVLRPGGALARRIDAAARDRMTPALVPVIEQTQADLVVGVFATGASAAAAAARRGYAHRVAVLCTDVTPHRLWVHEGVDVYLVTSPAAAAAVRRYQPRATVLVGPTPVRRGFRSPPTQAQARQALGIPAGDPCVLVMTGGWGLGPVGQIASTLASRGVHVIAVAGRNERLRRRLEAVAARHPAVRVFGFTTRIPELMSASDLVLTTSGDTCAEARAVGRDLLLLDLVPGHGRDNVQHELELGHAAVTSADPVAVSESATVLLETVATRPATDPTPRFARVVCDALQAMGLG
jgi:UDP-N-acetylglucosamine:LPS N-acetylglucosamine transferase